MFYIIQENVFKEHSYNNLKDILEKLRIRYEEVRVYPFIEKIVSVSNIPDSEYEIEEIAGYECKEENIFVFGSIKLSRLTKKENWLPGTMLNEEHDFEVYSRYFKEELLNGDSEIKKVGDELLWEEWEKKFIRPTKDTKSFNGGVFSKEEWERTIKISSDDSSMLFNKETKIQVSIVKEIYKEIRFWVVGGKVVSYSTYKISNSIFYDTFVEESAKEFAQEMVDRYQIAEAFVIDICLTIEGWKIVEFNCINAAGFYNGDLERLIISLEEYYG